jgi:hypothetical protein
MQAYPDLLENSFQGEEKLFWINRLLFLAVKISKNVHND